MYPRRQEVTETGGGGLDLTGVDDEFDDDEGGGDEEPELTADERYQLYLDSLSAQFGGAPSTGELWTDQGRPTITNPIGRMDTQMGDDVWDYGGTQSGDPREQYRPRYSTTYALSYLNGLGVGGMAALEQQLYAAGYLGEDEPDAIVDRNDLVSGFRNLVKRSDTNRNRWQDQLNYDIDEYQRFLDEGGGDEKEPYSPFVAPDEPVPDYATLAQTAKNLMRQQLGRSPSDSEMKLLTDQLYNDYSKAYKANMYDTSRSAWEKNKRAYETGEDQAGQKMVQVQPEDRFNEFFEERYAGELNRRERVDTQEEKRNSLFGSLDMMTRKIG